MAWVSLWPYENLIKCVNFSFFLCDFPPIHGAISTEVWQCSLATHFLGTVYSLHKSARKGHEKGKTPQMTSSLFLSKEIIMLKVEQNHRKSWTTVFLITSRKQSVKYTYSGDLRRKNKVVFRYTEWFSLPFLYHLVLAEAIIFSLIFKFVRISGIFKK